MSVKDYDSYELRGSQRFLVLYDIEKFCKKVTSERGAAKHWFFMNPEDMSAVEALFTLPSTDGATSERIAEQHAGFKITYAGYELVFDEAANMPDDPYLKFMLSNGFYRAVRNSINHGMIPVYLKEDLHVVYMEGSKKLSIYSQYSVSDLNNEVSEHPESSRWGLKMFLNSHHTETLEDFERTVNTYADPNSLTVQLINHGWHSIPSNRYEKGDYLIEIFGTLSLSEPPKRGIGIRIHKKHAEFSYTGADHLLSLLMAIDSLNA